METALGCGATVYIFDYALKSGMIEKFKGAGMARQAAKVTAIGKRKGAAAKAIDAPELPTLEHAYTRLKQSILHNEHKPGSILSQVKLSRELGVSRTPLREALRRLEKEGLVESRHNRRIRIPSLSIADLEDLYALRISIESLGIRLSVSRMTAEDLRSLDQTLHRMADCQRRGDVTSWQIQHREFHRSLVKHTGSRHLSLINELSDHAERYRLAVVRQAPRVWGDGEAEHAAIVSACKSRDAQKAAETLAKHLAKTALIIMMNEAPDHEPAAIRAALRSVPGGTD
jgi:DNA-binding GntR family transcriptional regulator